MNIRKMKNKKNLKMQRKKCKGKEKVENKSQAQIKQRIHSQSETISL